MERRLLDEGYNVLDGDELRGDLNSDLGFSDEDRSQKVRRIAAIATTRTNLSRERFSKFMCAQTLPCVNGGPTRGVI